MFIYTTKTDAVFARLVNAILRGELKPGERVTAKEWARKSGVSEIPVREAIRRLEAQGLVRVDPHRGASVTASNRAHVEETHQMRFALETLATRLAVDRSSPNEIAGIAQQVQDLVDEMDVELVAGNLRRVHEINLNIHMTVYRASGMPRLVELIQSLWVTYAVNIITLTPDIPYQIGQHHHELVAALKSGEADSVVAVVQDDLRHVHQIVMRTHFPQGDVSLSVGVERSNSTTADVAVSEVRTEGCSE